VDISCQHIKTFKGELVRFINRIPLVARHLDIEKGLIAKFKATYLVDQLEVSIIPVFPL
jgi:hypothetical protein